MDSKLVDTAPEAETKIVNGDTTDSNDTDVDNGNDSDVDNGNNRRDKKRARGADRVATKNAEESKITEAIINGDVAVLKAFILANDIEQMFRRYGHNTAQIADAYGRFSSANNGFADSAFDDAERRKSKNREIKRVMVLHAKAVKALASM